MTPEALPLARPDPLSPSGVSEKKIENGVLVVSLQKAQLNIIKKMSLFDAYETSLIKNTTYVSSSILIDIMRKLSDMKKLIDTKKTSDANSLKDILGLVTSLHVIHHNGAKVYMASDVGDIISRIVIAEMGVEKPEPVPVQIDQSNIVSPFVHDEKIAAAVTETSVSETSVSETLVSETLTEEPVKREPLPYIVSIRAEVNPATGDKKTSHADFKPSMNLDEKNSRVVGLVEGLFVGGICNGKFTVNWSNGNNLVQEIDPENVHASIAFVLSMHETETRNIAVNNA